VALPGYEWSPADESGRKGDALSKLLIVDDEPQIVHLLRSGMTREGYQVIAAGNGEDGLAAAAVHSPELMILDLGLPDMDGKAVIQRLRTWSQMPVIMLSGRADDPDKVAALDAGADDYVTKPFSMPELLARMRASLRRAEPLAASENAALRFGQLEVDLRLKRVRRAGAPLHLTPIEYALLEALVTNPGKLLTHAWLLSKVWGRGYSDETAYLRVYVRQLRQKLGDDARVPRLIATEPRVGYRWLPDPDPQLEA
jgi:DNA-binding response OmpR family regulator